MWRDRCHRGFVCASRDPAFQAPRIYRADVELERRGGRCDDGARQREMMRLIAAGARLRSSHILLPTRYVGHMCASHLIGHSARIMNGEMGYSRPATQIQLGPRQ